MMKLSFIGFVFLLTACTYNDPQEPQQSKPHISIILHKSDLAGAWTYTYEGKKLGKAQFTDSTFSHNSGLDSRKDLVIPITWLNDTTASFSTSTLRTDTFQFYINENGVMTFLSLNKVLQESYPLIYSADFILEK